MKNPKDMTKIKAKTIIFPSGKPNQLLENLDELLCIMGGKETYHLSDLISDVEYYRCQYNFPKIGIVLVNAPYGPKNTLNNDGGMVQILGFEQDAFYNQMNRALTDLKNGRL
jgi:hypothetical protein